jgi:hypothetical protein
MRGGWIVDDVWGCRKCGESEGEDNPDYCSKKSPRELLEEAVDKAVEMVGAVQYAEFLETELGLHDKLNLDRFDVVKIARATNQQIATAIYHATQEEGK